MHINTPVENIPVGNTGVDVPNWDTNADVGAFAPMNADNTEEDLGSYDWENQVAERFHDASNELLKGRGGMWGGAISTPQMPFLRQ